VNKKGKGEGGGGEGGKGWEPVAFLSLLLFQEGDSTTVKGRGRGKREVDRSPPVFLFYYSSLSRRGRQLTGKEGKGKKKRKGEDRSALCFFLFLPQKCPVWDEEIRRGGKKKKE